ncbi:MAG: serine hydrolase domain-containing protein [Candidatus Acidiferrales bacterium]
MSARRHMAAAMLFVFFAGATGASRAGAKAAQVDRLFRDYAGEVPGASVIVTRDERAIFRKSYGLANVEQRRKATPRTTYRLASVSKQFTAMAALMLAERGKLSLDDELTRFFPDFPAYGKQIRVRHLLAHTSGLLAYEDFIPDSATEPVLDRDVLEILKRQQGTYFPPGSQFRYSNSGYALLACIVEQVSGLSFPAFLKRNIFAPLGMRDTYMNLRAAAENSRRAYGYTKRSDSFERTDQSMTSYVLGDGGIYSSAEDLAKWERALGSARLVRWETLEQAMAQQIATGSGGGDGVSYGYGWYVGEHRGLGAVWHEGTTVGFRNFYLRIPDKKLAVIVLANRSDARPEELARAVMDLFLEEAPSKTQKR